MDGAVEQASTHRLGHPHLLIVLGELCRQWAGSLQLWQKDHGCLCRHGAGSVVHFHGGCSDEEGCNVQHRLLDVPPKSLGVLEGEEESTAPYNCLQLCQNQVLGERRWEPGWQVPRLVGGQEKTSTDTSEDNPA